MYLCSFVHGFERPDFAVPDGARACLALLTDDGVHDIVGLEFPRVPSDFGRLDLDVVGESPAVTDSYLPLPRFGVTGLATDEDRVDAGSWNGVYRLDPASMSAEAFLTNRLTADVHGLAVADGVVTTTLPPVDGVVQSDSRGEIVGSWRIGADLSIAELDPDGEPDWRFVGKQMRGPLGHFHFNNVEVVDDVIFLTSRNLGCYLSMRPGDRRARLHPIAHMTPVMMHDGVLHASQRYATSVDAKVLIHGEPDPSALDSYSRYLGSEGLDGIGVHSMSESVIRLEEVLGRSINWCRGLEVARDRIVTSIDGRYGSGRRFGLLQLDGSGKLVREDVIRWSDVGEVEELRYVTGFDVALLPDDAAR